MWELLLLIWIPLHMAYAWGMADYAQRNNIHSRQLEIHSLRSTLGDELDELYEAIQHMKPLDIVLEAFDSLHSLIKLLIAMLPGGITLLKCPAVWIFIFPIILPVGVKHAWRYIRFNCIRNHKNQRNLDHNCEYRP